MPKLKERVTLKCAGDEQVSAALSVLSDPNAHEDDWVSAASVIDERRKVEEDKLPATASDDPAPSPKAKSRPPNSEMKLLRRLAAGCAAIFVCLFVHAVFLCFGQFEFDRADYKACLTMLKVATATNPLDGRAYLLRAKALNRLGKFKSAAKSAGRAMISAAAYQDALVERAWANIGRGKADWAKKDAERLLRLDAAQADALLGAVEYVEIAKDAKLDDPLFNGHNAPAFDKAYTKMRLAVANGCTRPELFKYKGLCEQRLSQWAAADDDLSTALQLGLADYNTFRARATTAQSLFNYPDALNDLQECLRLDQSKDPHGSVAQDLADAAQIYLLDGQHENAIRIARQAIEAEPSLWQAYETKASAELALSEHRAAIDDYSLANSKGSPNDLANELAIAESLASLGDRAAMEKQLAIVESQATAEEDVARIRAIATPPPNSPGSDSSIRTLANFRQTMQNEFLRDLPPDSHVTPLQGLSGYPDETHIRVSLIFANGGLANTSMSYMRPTVGGQSLRATLQRIRSMGMRLPPGVFASPTIDLYFLDESPLLVQ